MDQLATVSHLNLDGVQTNLVNRMGLEAEMATHLTELYRKFLYLKIKYAPEALVIPKMVDDAWHCHILDTKSYAKDCDTLFGTFMHHDPFPDDKIHAAGWRRTKELFMSEFGIDLEKSELPLCRVPGECV